MEFIRGNDIKQLSNPGVVSKQLLNPENSESTNVTITEVHLVKGSCQDRHIHENSEQIWYAIKGHGQLLLANDVLKDFSVGDVVRFCKGDIHGLLNNSNEEFVYISVTSLPINFTYAYKDKK